MSLEMVLMVVGLVVTVLSASIWAACAHWLQTGMALRLAAGTVLPLLLFWLLLWVDDSPLNMALFVVFLFPLLLLEAAVLFLLERRRLRETA